MEEYLSKSLNETYKIASAFARTLKRGDIVLLDGDLGAGKTMFSKGIVEAISGGKETAVSPTFVLMNIYNTNPEIYHFDLYRILDSAELDAFGAEEYIFGNGISLVEWPNRVKDYFPEKSIKVTISKIEDNTRKILIER